MKTILIANDFSEAGNNAMDYSIELAKYFAAKLVIVNAYPDSPAYDLMNGYERAAMKVANTEKCLDMLHRRIVEKEYYGLKTEAYSAMGEPVEIIKNAAANFNADLIVMGITGKPSLVKEHFIGSTATRVAHDVKINTFIIPGGVKFRHISRISFACDFENSENSTLVYIAKYFSKLFDAKLRVINITGEWIKAEKLKTLEFVEEKLKTVEHKVDFIIEADTAGSLEKEIDPANTDALIISPKEHNFFYTLLNGSLTKKIAFHARVPIIIIH